MRKNLISSLILGSTLLTTSLVLQAQEMVVPDVEDLGTLDASGITVDEAHELAEHPEEIVPPSGE